MIPVPSSDPPLRLINCILPKHLLATIYGSPKNLTPNDMQVSTLREALSLAVQIKSCPEQKVKVIEMTLIWKIILKMALLSFSFSFYRE